MASITFTQGNQTGRDIDLQDPGLIIGRNSDCSLMLDDLGTSGKHAQIHKENGDWFVTDLNSSNGTQLNDQDIDTARLTHDDLITIGETQLRFINDVPAAPKQADTPTHTAPAEADAPTPTPPAPASRKTPKIKASADDIALVEKMKGHTDAIRSEVGKVIVGQQEVLDQVLMCIIAGGHALLIGLPGLAKTLMVSTIAKVLNMQFKRIQFTPDLMPSDITGTEILETNKDTMEKEFRFVKGPIFCNMLLADEINRTPPKTQAALLEAMQEKHISVGNMTYDLDPPFFVLATQNPIEQEGTYPLPEAQLDRFMFNIWVDYPKAHEEEQIVASTTVAATEKPEAVLGQKEVLQLQDVVRKIPVSPHVVKYVIKLVRATRPGVDDAPEFVKKYVSTGAGPRAGQYLVLAAKARAVLEGRIHVGCSDIRAAAAPVLRHRIYTNFAADSEGIASMDIIKRIVEQVEEPGEEAYDSQ